MSDNIALVSELLIALPAVEEFLTRVRLHVVYEPALSGELLVANIAHETLYSAVVQLVPLHVVLVCEHLEADRALVGFLSGVLPQMRLDESGVSERFGAIFALERSVPGMPLHVPYYSTLVLKICAA